MSLQKIIRIFFVICLFGLLVGLIACSQSDDIDVNDVISDIATEGNMNEVQTTSEITSDLTAEENPKTTETTSDLTAEENPESTETTAESITGDTKKSDNVDNKQTSSLNVDTTKKGTTSSKNKDIKTSAILFDNQKYYFPVIVKNFFNKNWTYNGKTCDKSIFNVLNKNTDCNLFLSYSNGDRINVKEAYVPSKTNGYQAETVINKIVLDGANCKDGNFWVLPGGITAQSTAADVLEIYGSTSDNKNFSKVSHISENKISYSSQKKSGISYIFSFNSDGSIDSVEVSMSKKKLQEPVVYKNKYFSVSLPGYWRGKFFVENNSTRTYEFRFIEGKGLLFTVYLLNQNEPFEYHANNIVFGTLSKTDSSFEVVYEEPSDWPVSEQFATEYNNLSNGMNINILADCLSAAGDYHYKKADYSKYKGNCYEEVFDISEFYLEVKNVNFAEITFTYGFLSEMRVNLIEDINVMMSHGKGYFSTLDGWGYPCEGYIRFDGDNAYISITAPEQSDGYSSLRTNGEKKLSKYAEVPTTEAKTTEKKQQRKKQHSKTKKVISLSMNL